MNAFLRVYSPVSRQLIRLIFDILDNTLLLLFEVSKRINEYFILSFQFKQTRIS